ncbi:Asp-tRNA(Asn)/Glu-tRNA(Gln) amidotransferase subunit GatB [Sandaracinus amylolyticus]|uniref:Aspartyl/glutamyl-tRNA(Asn/Gln) amidotransferase subunit B n=1 Tax=Sandaracinus amylolyticus TaxID=927083 RepID=A0A0F6YL20_9BACT|nr:Asp-tRNA(Asn)/Glu-tRNA(Gln) amidotransferase subunit GatB [Sandaracinus amylolyticus]AKF09045.1 Aspartyl-tRNA(Asn) amidotransferase subunit B [Sandaracinus amylolyticus]
MSTAYETVIGLEVHAQLLTRTKMFCGCATAYGAPPNTQICPVCIGLPGALPVPNRQAIELAIRAALATGCEVRSASRFARKNYFYPDLAKGYQISQFELPMNEHGALEIDGPSGKKTVGIIRIHLEEDAAKNLHGVGAGTDTLVDFNRAGVPLIEIVGAPDLRSADEAEAYLRVLRDVLMFAGVNDGNLEEGSFRCDANVSIRPVGDPKLGTRVELKNINSFRFVKKAIEYEVARQEALVSSGGKVVQETRTWSEPQGKTLSMRSKEEAHDYRYFSDPDLPPLSVDPTWIDEVRAKMPEAIPARRARWQSELGLTEYDARVLSAHPGVAAWFESAVIDTAALTKQPLATLGKKVANFVQSEVLRETTTNGLEARFPVPPQRLAELLALVEGGTINGKIAKDVFADMVKTGKAPKEIVDKKGLAQVTDTGAIEAAIRKVVADNPKEVEKLKAGKAAVRGFFVGQVMKATRGTANPALVNEILDKVLAES